MRAKRAILLVFFDSEAAADINTGSIAITSRWLGQSAMRMGGRRGRVGSAQAADCCCRLAVTSLSLGQTRVADDKNKPFMSGSVARENCMGKDECIELYSVITPIGR